MGVKGSVYLNDNSKVRSNAGPTKGFLVVFAMALLTLFLGAQSSAITLLSSQGNQSQTASAGPLGILCGGKDDVVDGKPQTWNNISRYYPVSAATNRKWTLDEAYGAGLRYPLYFGEGGASNFLVVEATKDRGKGVGNYEEQVKKLETIRVAHTCAIGGVGVELLGNMPLMVGRISMSLITGLSSVVFDSSIICKDATAKEQGNCVNLLALIGGSSDTDNKSIIYKLTNGVYLPLATLIVLAAAMYIAWIGIVKRKLREAFGAAIWVFLSFIIGLTFLYKPTLLAKAPMAISNNISACIIGGYAGHSCTDGGDSSTIETKGDMSESDRVVCLSKANTSSADEEMSLIMNTMSCRLWKAFVLEPYSEGSFGRNFEDLDVNNPDTKKIIEKAKLKPEDFCVALTSSKSVDQQGSVLEMDSATDKICNVAAYQMFLQTNAKDTSGAGTTYNGKAGAAVEESKKKEDEAKKKADEEYKKVETKQKLNGDIERISKSEDENKKEDEEELKAAKEKKDAAYKAAEEDGKTVDSNGANVDWYKLVLFAAADDGIWGNWTPGESEALHKMFVSFLSIITVVAGGIVVAAIAAFAFIYYLTSLFLMAFAPLFFLLGIHPGRGKEILVGWGETVLENVFKYIASAMFLVVTVAIYDAVLSNLKNLGLTLLFVILLSIALFLYRKEIVNLIGKVNMGGKRLSNKFEEKVAPRLKRATAATAGGAVGAAWTNGMSASNFMHGAKQGMKRDLMRDRKSFIGATLGERERMINDNKQDLKSHAGAYASKAAEARQDKREVDKKLTTAKDSLSTNLDQYNSAKETAQENTEKIEAQNAVKADVLLNASGLDDTFRKMQALTNELAAMKLQRDMAAAMGDMAEADRIDAEMIDIARERDNMLTLLDGDTLDRNMELYNNEVRRGMEARGIDGSDVSAEFINATRAYALARERAFDDMNTVNSLAKESFDLGHQGEVNTKIAKQLNDNHRDLRDGEKLSGADVRELISKAEQEHAVAPSSFIPGTLQNLAELPMLNNLYDDAYMARLNSLREDPQTTKPDVSKINLHAIGAFTNVNETVDLDPLANLSGTEGGINAGDYNVGFTNPNTGALDNMIDLDEGSFYVNDDNSVTFTPAPDFIGATPEVNVTVETKNGTGTTSAPMSVVVNDPNGSERSNTNNGIPSRVGDRIDLNNQDTTTMVNEPVNINPFKESTISNDLKMDDMKVSLRNAEGEALDNLSIPEGSFKVNEDNSVTFTPAQDYIGEAPAVSVSASTLDGSEMDTASLKVTVENRPGGNGGGGPTPPPDNGGTGYGETMPRPNSGGGIPVPPVNPEADRASQASSSLGDTQVIPQVDKTQPTPTQPSPRQSTPVQNKPDRVMTPAPQSETAPAPAPKASGSSAAPAGSTIPQPVKQPSPQAPKADWDVALNTQVGAPKGWGTVDGNAPIAHQERMKRPQSPTEYTSQPRPRNETLGRSNSADSTPTPRKKDADNFFDLSGE